MKTADAEVLDKALAFAFSYESSETVLVEDFIPGREIRCGVVDTLSGLKPLPAMVEYVMNKEMPIRTVTDKIQANSDGSGMKQTKCERVIPADIDAELSANLKDCAERAHRAVRSQDYSLFDFRVHEETGEPYIIEACMFWSFSNISAISLLINASRDERFGEHAWPNDLEETVLSCWRNAARRTREKRPSLLNNLRQSSGASTTASE